MNAHPKFGREYISTMPIIVICCQIAASVRPNSLSILLPPNPFPPGVVWDANSEQL